MEKITQCDHTCSGDCRRVGCNCGCGEYHDHEDRGLYMFAKEQIAFEEHMLKMWTRGEDMSTLPEGWSAEKQKIFVGGMKHTLDIIRNPEQY